MSYLKVHFKFWKMFLQAQQTVIYLVEIFCSVWFKFLDVLGDIWSHLGAVEDGKASVPSVPTGQDCSKRSILSGLDDIFSAIFRGGSSGHYSKAIINKIKKNLHTLQENQNLQCQQIQGEFALLKHLRVELEDKTILLHMLAAALIWISIYLLISLLIWRHLEIWCCH